MTAPGRDTGTSTNTQPWQTRAACRGKSPTAFFPPNKAKAQEAATVCARCPVITDCAQAADRYHDDGVRGGAWRITASNGRAPYYDGVIYLVRAAPRHRCTVPRCCTGQLLHAGHHLWSCPVWGAPVVDANTCTCPRGDESPPRSVAELARARDRMVAEYEARRGEAS